MHSMGLPDYMATNTGVAEAFYTASLTAKDGTCLLALIYGVSRSGEVVALSKVDVAVIERYLEDHHDFYSDGKGIDEAYAQLVDK